MTAEWLAPENGITLREAVALGLWPSLAAARRRAARPGFPQPVGTLYLAKLYALDDLQALREGRNQPVSIGDIAAMRAARASIEAREASILREIEADTWKPIPNFTGYQASHRAMVLDGIRSVDRTVNDRRYAGQSIAGHLSGRGYPRVKIRRDDGRLITVEIHVLVMAAHEGRCPPGLQVRHWNDDPLDNRWAPGGEDGCRAGAGNLVYGTPKQNSADKLRNRPSPPPRQRRSRRVSDYVGSRLRRRRV